MQRWSPGLWRGSGLGASGEGVWGDELEGQQVRPGRVWRGVCCPGPGLVNRPQAGRGGQSTARGPSLQMPVGLWDWRFAPEHTCDVPEVTAALGGVHGLR